MKKVVVLLMALAISGTALAQHGHRGHHHHGRNDWVAPALIGGIIGYGISRNQYNTQVAPYPPPVYHRPPVYYAPPAVVFEEVIPPTFQPNVRCGFWVETINPDGTITRSRTCSQ